MEIGSPAPEIANTGSESVDVDGILNSIEEPSSGFPMSEPASAVTPAQPEPQKHTITVNGQQITATLEQLQKWAQQGYDYPQKMQAFKQQQTEFEQRYKPYQDIDDYAKQNPQWWSTVQKAWDSRTEQQQAQAVQSDPNNPFLQKLSQFEEKFSKLEQVAQTYQQEKQNQLRQSEDQQLTTEIQSMREQYKHLDWNAADDRGYNLELQVMAYANERGIKKFDDAFKSYNLDRLMSIAQERGKEQVGKDIQKRTKLGLLGQSPTPTVKSKYEYDKSKSYEQLEREALEELGIKSS